VRAPIDRRSSTFEELVDETLAVLEQADRLWLFPNRDEDAVLVELAEFQRRVGRSPRTDAFAAACWRYWLLGERP
jgi:hypothetical protein